MRARSFILWVPILAAAATNSVPSAPIRATGVIRAVNSVTILVPFIEGQGGNLALATLAENGSLVNVGDSLATFDRANELKLLRDAQTKFEDLARQIEEKKAEHLVTPKNASRISSRPKPISRRPKSKAARARF